MSAALETHSTILSRMNQTTSLKASLKSRKKLGRRKKLKTKLLNWLRRIMLDFRPVRGNPEPNQNSEESFLDNVQMGQAQQPSPQNGERQATLPQPALINRVTAHPTQPNQPDALARPATAAVGNIPLQDDIFDSRILANGDQANSSFNFSFESEQEANSPNPAASRPTQGNPPPRPAPGPAANIRNFDTAPRAQQAL